MATNFNNVRNRNNRNSRSQNNSSEKKSRNWLAIILIIVFIFLCIGLIFNTVMYFKSGSKPAVLPVQTTETVINNLPNNINNAETITEFGKKAKDAVTSAQSPQAIVMNLFALVFTGGSFWLLLFLKKFDQKNYYNVSNSITIISNNRFFYISLIMGVLYAFYIGGSSLIQNINNNVNIDINILIEKSTFIQKVYAVLSFILLIENYVKTGFSIPVTLARTGIFVTIGLTFIVVGYIIGMILFYIFVIWLVFKIFFGMMAAERKRREEQDRMDRVANSIVDAFERRWGL